MPALNRSHKKVLRTLKTKCLQNFDNLRKVTGMLISTNFPKKTKIDSFSFLILVWVWDRLAPKKGERKKNSKNFLSRKVLLVGIKYSYRKRYLPEEKLRFMDLKDPCAEGFV